MKIIPWFLLLIFMIPVAIQAVDTFETCYVNGIAPMTIDGDLSDWEGIDLPVFQITNLLNFRNVVPPSSEDDLSASFKCFADAEYVFVAITVIDDNVIVGNHMFSKGWHDDSVEICFDGDLVDTSKPYFDANDGQVRFVADQDGITLLEGGIPYVYETPSPYFWEARGIRGGFQNNPNGYVIEAAIPLQVLGWESGAANQSMGINIRIFDDDGQENGDNLDSGLSWVEDPHNTSFWKTQYYNRLTFDTLADSPNLIVERSGLSISANTNHEILIDLGTPDYNVSDSIIKSMLQCVANEDWQGASNSLNAEKDKVWAMPLAGVMAGKAGNKVEALDLFFRFADASPDQRAKDWVWNHLYSSLKTVTPMDIQEPIIAVLKRVVETAKDEYITKEASLRLMHSYYYNGDFEKALVIADEIQKSELDDKSKLKAKMVRISFEWRENY